MAREQTAENNELFNAKGLKRWSTIKYWISADQRREIGAWAVSTPDEDIMAELLAQCGNDDDRSDIRSGTIEVGEWK